MKIYNTQIMPFSNVEGKGEQIQMEQNRRKVNILRIIAEKTRQGRITNHDIKQ